MQEPQQLGKIAVEEAYQHPNDSKRILSDETELARVSDGGGVMPSYYRPIQSLLAEFDEIRLTRMDAAGIDHAILSLTAPGIQAIVDSADAEKKARSENDFLAEVVRRHPSRYSGFAAVPLQNAGAAAQELERAVVDLGFKGAMVNGYTSTQHPERGIYLDEAANDRFWEKLCELDVPLYLHPRSALSGGLRLYEGHPELKGATWGFGAETATHVLRIIFSGVFDRFPDAKLIVGHMGEALPALLWRTQNMFDLNPFDKRPQKTLEEYFADNIWITTSGSFSDSSLTNAILAIGSDRIMFSVDYPYSENQPAANWIEHAPISVSDRRKFCSGNARRLFRITVA
ncbi:amidohydrolase family protein [Propioniciclava flava]|uniref:Amidohydrolase n=1 Tax=Propioniciclava flava TaxID=2072026 RepID=A0A4Q2EL96_9ACTN|nr:amidohydrolase family protein [Propioniciclava flava]RXW33552.1 amidohydrolase [Propioniciclava flava]